MWEMIRLIYFCRQGWMMNIRIQMKALNMSGRHNDLGSSRIQGSRCQKSALVSFYGNGNDMNHYGYN